MWPPVSPNGQPCLTSMNRSEPTPGARMDHSPAPRSPEKNLDAARITLYNTVKLEKAPLCAWLISLRRDPRATGLASLTRATAICTEASDKGSGIQICSHFAEIWHQARSGISV